MPPIAEHSVKDRLNASLMGRYRVEREIGSGRTAIVYLAYDVRHDRPVALKVLRADLAAVIGAKRFLVEIRTIANLQHPHILPLFDSGEVDEFLFFTMPYIEGETLHERIQRERQLPIAEAIRIGVELAETLDYAHRHGVIHRDVKPANILLHEGRPLVADFGISLAVTSAAEGRLTEAGLSVGTPQYMSPEQAVGDVHIDARTDVYALACVVYEMLAGRPPFDANTAQAVLAHVLTTDPGPVTEWRRRTPPHVAAALNIALQKVPADRFPDARTFAEALRSPSESRVPGSAALEARHWGSQQTQAPARWMHRVSVGLNGILLLAVLGLVGSIASRGRAGTEGPSPWVTRFQLQSSLGVHFGTPALSPDGRLMAWSSDEGIRIRSLDHLNDRLIPQTDSASFLFFSPDSKHLGFSIGSGFELRTVPVDGGPQRILADSAGLSVWGDDGFVYFYRVTEGGPPWIGRVPDIGGRDEIVLRMDMSRTFAPRHVLPQRRGILGTVADPRGAAVNSQPQVAVLNPSTGDLRVLFSGGSPWYEPQTRHIVFSRRNNLMAVAYDADRMRVTGTPFPVANDVESFGLASDGTLWTILGALPNRIPVLLGRHGLRAELMPELTLDDVFSDGSFSPDGRRLAFEFRSTDSDRADVWLYDLPDGPRMRLTHDGGTVPTWSLDGRFVLFVRSDGVYRIRADGSAPPERLLAATAIQWVQPVPGGGIVFERNNGNDTDVAFASLESDEAFDPLLDGVANEERPAVSRDGRWLAYVSDESGRPEVYVMPLGQPGRGQRVSVAGGHDPSFSWGGTELFFVNANRQFEVLRFSSEPGFEILERSILFDASRFASRLQPAPGDSTFLGTRGGGSRRNSPIIIARNWVQELQDRANEARTRRIR